MNLKLLIILFNRLNYFVKMMITTLMLQTSRMTNVNKVFGQLLRNMRTFPITSKIDFHFLFLNKISILDFQLCRNLPIDFKLAPSIDFQILKGGEPPRFIVVTDVSKSMSDFVSSLYS